VSAIAALRVATWPSHQRLERRIDLKARLASAATYRAHLEQLWGFYAALEPQLAAGIYPGHLADFNSRRKVPLLERDLLALGTATDALRRLPLCTAAPPCGDAAEAFGCAYVLEGATLGGRTLLPAVATRLGVTAESGAAYLASYGAAVGEMWRSFGAALDRCCADPARQARAAGAATATFVALESWLCGSVA
jgi:heme oxygenase (biliverdin-IX-beta and delta-forming)